MQKRRSCLRPSRITRHKRAHLSFTTNITLATTMALQPVAQSEPESGLRGTHSDEAED